MGEALTGGGLLTDVVIEITRAPAGLSRSTYFEGRLREAFVIDQLLKSAGADPTPTESVSLNYSRMDWIYRVLSPDGVALEQSGAYWDFVDNSGVLLTVFPEISTYIGHHRQSIRRSRDYFLYRFSGKRYRV